MSDTTTENMRQYFEADGSPRRLDSGTAVAHCAVATGSACLFCANDRQIKPQCTKQRWKVCKDHFMITCPKCGHEGFWMENMKSGSYFACFSLDCNWRSTTPPNIGGQTQPPTTNQI